MKLRHVCSLPAAGVLIFSFTSTTAKVDSQMRPRDRLGVDWHAREPGNPALHKRRTALAIPASAFAPDRPPRPTLPVLRRRPVAVHSRIATPPSKVETEDAQTVTSSNVQFATRLGAFSINLPSTALHHSGNGSDEPVDGRTRLAGDAQGQKLGAEISARVANTALGDVVLGIDGFLAAAGDAQTLACRRPNGRVGCASYGNKSAGSGIVTATIQHDVTYRGAALKAGLEASPAISLFAGGDLRRLHQTTTLGDVSNQLATPLFAFDATLKTIYAGAFAGATGQADLGHGFFANGTAQIGLYRAKAKMSGRSHNMATGFSSVGNDSTSKTTYIGSLKSELGYAAGGFRIAAFAELEGIGWVPSMAYHLTTNQDLDVVARRMEIRAGDAFSYTVGGRLNVKF